MAASGKEVRSAKAVKMANTHHSVIQNIASEGSDGGRYKTRISIPKTKNYRRTGPKLDQVYELFDFAYARYTLWVSTAGRAIFAFRSFFFFSFPFQSPYRCAQIAPNTRPSSKNKRNRVIIRPGKPE